jgi:hypothetical protein
MHDDFGSLAVLYSTAAAVLLSFIRITCLMSAARRVHGRDRLPGHCLVLVPFPGFHVVRMNCLVDREQYLDCTWIYYVV